MFKIPLFNRKKIVSDQGFIIEFQSRNVLKYEAPGLSLLIDIDGGRSTMYVIAKSMRTCEPQQHPPDEATQQTIAGNIASALEWRGWRVQIIE